VRSRTLGVSCRWPLEHPHAVDGQCGFRHLPAVVGSRDPDARLAACLTARSPWAWVGLLCATATASYLCRVNVSVAGALLMDELHLSQAQMGQVFSAFLLGYALFMVPGGALADRWGTRRVLELASWWWVAATALQVLVGRGPLAGSVASTLGALLGLRFLLGVGQAPTFPAAARGVSGWISPDSRARANGFVIAAIALGSAIAPPLVSAVMVRWGWRAALGISTLPALATAVAWRIAGEPVAAAAAPSPSPDPDASSAPLRSRSFVLLTLSYSLQGYVGYIFVFWFYLYLVQERHFDLLKGAFLSSLPWLLSIISIPFGGWLSDRIAARHGLVVGRRAVPLAGLALAGIFLSLGARTTNGYLAAAYLALSTALVLCVEGPFWATMTEIAGGRSGLAGGIMNTGCNVGGLVSPALTPALAAVIGWENALHVAAVLSLVAAVLWLGIDPRARGAAFRSEDPARRSGSQDRTT
jgi:MFS transporter, ACS family, glucarate transporter